MLPLRILLVDDSIQFLDVVARALATVPAIEIVGRALSGRDAVEQVTQLQPDLVLMDVAMPNMNGLEATRRIKTQADAPHVVILTLHDTPEYRAAAEAVGADNFVSKAEFNAQMLPLIRTLCDEKEI
jgi:DNA-binding NarL/FixJ family response regulator